MEPSQRPSFAPSAVHRVPRLVWAATALHVGLMLCFSLLFPPFTQFDETQHVDAVLSLRSGDGWPPPGHRLLSEGVLQAAAPVIDATRHLPFTDDPLSARRDRRSFAQLGGDKPNGSYPVPNQMTQHPPGYYALAAAVLAAIPGSGGWSVGVTVEFLRLLSILLFAPLPLLAWATARALRAGPQAATLAAVLPLTAPQLERVGASVNNDALLVLTFSVAALLVARVAMGDVRRRTALLLGGVLGVALLTKGFALALVPAVGLGYVLARGAAWGRRWRSGLLALTVAFVTGGWWWVHNLAVYGTVQPSGTPAAWRPAVLGNPLPPGVVLSRGRFVIGTFHRLTWRFWGSLGINYEPPHTFAPWVTDLLFGLSVAAVLVALVGWRRRLQPVLVAVMLPFFGTLVVVVLGAYGGYKYSGSYPGAQGRYLFGSMAGLAAVAAFGLCIAAGRARRLLLPAAVLVVGIMQVIGLRAVLRLSWLNGSGARSSGQGLREAFNGIVRYSPFDSAVVPAVLGLTVLAGLLLLVAAVSSAATSASEGCLELVQEPRTDDGNVTAVDRPLNDLEHHRLRAEDGVHDPSG